MYILRDKVWPFFEGNLCSIKSKTNYGLGQHNGQVIWHLTSSVFGNLHIHSCICFNNSTWVDVIDATLATVVTISSVYFWRHFLVSMHIRIANFKVNVEYCL